MRCSVFVLPAAVVAVAIAGCKREEAGQQAHGFQVSQGFQVGEDPQVSQEPRTSEEPQVSQEPRAGDGPQVGNPPQANQGSATDEEPLLLLDDEPPLLLDDGQQEFLPPSGPVADNSRCYVCHLNYMQEDLAVVHAEADIGCADCHGNCDDHIADESWASGGNGTPPGIMYPRAKINPFCTECHPKDKIDPKAHKRFFAGAADEKYCTDCHGEHRLAERKCKWK